MSQGVINSAHCAKTHLGILIGTLYEYDKKWHHCFVFMSFQSLLGFQTLLKNFNFHFRMKSNSFQLILSRSRIQTNILFRFLLQYFPQFLASRAINSRTRTLEGHNQQYQFSPNNSQATIMSYSFTVVTVT